MVTVHGRSLHFAAKTGLLQRGYKRKNQEKIRRGNMRKEKLQSYSARVAQANRTGLLVIVYEIIEEELSVAMECYKEADMEGFDNALKNGQKFLGELMGTLDISTAFLIS